jgi:hypothetical protein
MIRDSEARGRGSIPRERIFALRLSADVSLPLSSFALKFLKNNDHFF